MEQCNPNHVLLTGAEHETGGLACNYPSNDNFQATTLLSTNCWRYYISTQGAQALIKCVFNVRTEPPIETERQTRRWMRKENLYFNSRCCSPQGSGNLKSLSNYFGLSMMSSSGPHKIALLVGSLHLAITGQWLPHTTRPSFQSRILNKSLPPGIYI